MLLSELRQKSHLSASSIGDYLECGMLYRFSRIDRLPMEFVADAMEFGSVIHIVLAEYYQAKMTGDIQHKRENPSTSRILPFFNLRINIFNSSHRF
jgi:hypothetical protein